MCSFRSVIGYPGRPGGLVVVKRIKGWRRVGGTRVGVRFARELKLILAAKRIVAFVWP